jgi:hypothetical protein
VWLSRPACADLLALSIRRYGDAARSEHGEIEVRRRFNDFTQLRAELVAKAQSAQSADGASPRAAALAGALSLPTLPGKVLFASQVTLLSLMRSGGPARARAAS